jgi:gliding motility-associated lipoprotein GldD
MGRAINGSINLFYKRLANKDSLPSLINFSNKEVDFHKIKADKIDFDQIIDQENKVYGTIFELKGDVATNYQFYLTDSAQHFLRGEVILNCVPNYDSLRNVLVYIKEDLDVMMNTLSWKSK